MNRLNVVDSAIARVRRRNEQDLVVPNNMGNVFRPRGEFHVKLYSEFGKLKAEEIIPNGIVDVGLDSALDVHLGGDTQIATWYIGLVDNSGWTAFADTDTMASHAGWTEFQTYSEANRPTWGAGAAASQSITNATPEDFNITGSGTLKGVFVTSDNTKGGATGTLWSTAAFASTIAVVNTDLLKITYTVSAA